jgi:isoquinoline 1-oxidoreductase subunit beta
MATRTSSASLFTRRNILVGVAAAGGLSIGWALWPRSYPVNLVAAEGETIFNAWIKIGRDGHVTVALPQIEMGQGSYTLLAQIIADELGADWRTINIEPAPISPAYGNTVFATETQDGYFDQARLQITGGSSTVRSFEKPAREAAAAARILLCKAAAVRLDAAWEACDTDAGFVFRGADKLRFGELADDAANHALPAEIPLRTSSEQRLIGRGMSRLDIPAKLDGSATYAGDIRIKDMVYAAIRQGPLGESRLAEIDKKAADEVRGIIGIVEHDRWVAAIATNWWAANRALDAMRPKFKTSSHLPDDANIAKALSTAMNQDGTRLSDFGDADAILASGKVVRADYSAGLAPHAALEPLTATATLKDGKLQLWIATQSPELARKAAALAIGISVDDVTIHATQLGGSFGRKYEVDVAAQAAILALKIEKPVQLVWSRAEDMMHDPFRPAARAKLTARIEAAGKIDAWHAKITAPNGLGEMLARNEAGMSAFAAQQSLATKPSLNAVTGAIPPYAIEHLVIEHVPVDIGVPTGKWRSGAASYTTFFTESFIDELSHASGVEPFSFRVSQLGATPRLALCLSKVATKGGWQGGSEGTGQGLACCSMLGSHIAVLAEAHIGDDQRVRVTKLVCVADVGRVINPDIARQQIEGGLLFGLAHATGNAVKINRGIASPRRLRDLHLPKLADMPEMSVELIVSKEAPGGIGEIAVPVIGPAIANALFAATGRRFRSLPLAPART